jgi:methylthioribose-1-phosphate isomerase
MKVLKGERRVEVRAVWFEDGKVRMIDQRLLPQLFKVTDLEDHHQVAEAIRNMTVRGAPSIGAAAAYGMAVASRNHANVQEAAQELQATRPTAYDLFYAIDHMLRSMELGDDPVKAADGYADQLVERCRRIGRYGAQLIGDEQNIMTHCNAGALATVDIGTALAPIRTAWDEGRHIYVYVSETRPRLQGMRLTAWELFNEGIPHSIIVDGAAGHFLRKDVNMVIVGADRIAANGDFANKIGTFDKAVLCRELGVPFYVAAPLSTFDFSIPTGDNIVIEDRSEDEVTHVGQERLAPSGSPALNPSFDMTRAKYVTGFITEVGVLRPPEIDKVRREKFSEEGEL